MSLSGQAVHKNSNKSVYSSNRSDRNGLMSKPVKIPDQIQLHLFGFNRLAQLDDFKGLNISSFDSTSPLLKAFKDDLHNYYAWPHSYKAIRIPPVSGTRLKQKIQGGILNL